MVNPDFIRSITGLERLELEVSTAASEADARYIIIATYSGDEVDLGDIFIGLSSDSAQILDSIILTASEWYVRHFSVDSMPVTFSLRLEEVPFIW